MSNPAWTTRIEYLQYCNNLGYNCPKCNAWLPLGETTEKALMVRASDALFDQCSSCGTHILINNISLPTTTVFEGFADSAAMWQRVTELTKKGKTQTAAALTQQPTEKKWWQIWK
jgi:hypothetical protein